MLDLFHLRHVLDGLSAPSDAERARAVAGESAAVAAVLRECGAGTGAEVLLIERATHPSDPWSGHMALPGGRMDPSDMDLCATATRETFEEVGLDLRAHAELAGELPIIDTRAHGLPHALTIAPYVFVLRGDPPIHAGPEVADVVWTPVSPLVSGAVDTEISVERAGIRVVFPGWTVGGRVVWGLTYRMLEGLFRTAGWL